MRLVLLLLLSLLIIIVDIAKKTLQIINSLLDRNNNIKMVFIDFPILSETSYIARKGV